ncbi:MULTISPECIES: FAD-dependent oxidoreductase [Serratia]|uniref:FAD-dependent oxidoreductase n=1 Tax=Serratia TaxID=613 RepID=UPI001574599F|nr:FAD-dependent monooxygenase [Serratia marcescens]MBI6134406.1 FAD-dependent monooxygenase [Serratia marcescens]MDN0026971.1 FAD-dependent monooxygenase [Serratia marcescens]NSM18551.1 FAD-dependent monooxygenase [Serratia marcescens]NSM47063.1 FAD-dependent monooxygenase [Serratia marcescens]
MTTTLSIGIIGAGPGGLCLAQGLRRFGIHATVFERDTTPQARDQGYRLRIDPTGQQALAACLPPAHYRLLCAGSAQNSGESNLWDPQLAPLNARCPEHWLPSSPRQAQEPSGDLGVHRQTLREILLTGLQDRVCFGYTLCEFAQTPQGVELQFANGEQVRVDVLIAADGVNSLVRRRCLPEAGPEDSGAVTLYGKTPLDAATRAQLAPELLRGVSVVFADGLSLVIEPMRFQAPMAQLAADYAPDCRLTPVDDYLYWACIGSAERLGGPARMEDVAALQARVRHFSQGWAPALQDLLAQTGPLSLSVRAVQVTQAMPVWHSERIAFLGDAVHAMSPAGGLGANTALADAASLAMHLAQVGSAAQALKNYGADLQTRGAAAIRLSRLASERLQQNRDAGDSAP